MADYLLQLSYSAPAWAAMIKRPENRVEAVRKSVETLGGKINGFWLSFGTTTWWGYSRCRTMSAPQLLHGYSGRRCLPSRQDDPAAQC
jgi:hypothetical protein